MIDSVVRHPFLDHPGPIAFAHRGGAAVGPENTVAAFRRAAALGYRYFETDVRATRDGVLVAVHDATLDRVAGRPGAVAELDWRELRRVRVGGTEPVPTLVELLEEFPQARFNVDVKADSAVGPLVEAVTSTACLHRICVGSFSGARLRELRRRLGPTLATSTAPGEVARVRLASLLRRAGRRVPAVATQVPVASGAVPVVDRRFVTHAHARGLQVHVWTVNDPAEMGRLLDLGVDGIMTDHPELLREVLLARGQWN